MVALYATPNDNLYPEIGVRVLRIIEPVRKKKDIPSHVPVVDIQPGSMVKLDGKPLPISWRNRTDVKFALLWRRRQKKRADRVCVSLKPLINEKFGRAHGNATGTGCRGG